MMKVLAVPFLFAFVLNAATPSNDLWKHTAPDDVKWMKVTFAGGFVYGGDAGIYSLDPTTGKVAWSRDDLKKIPEANIEELDGYPILLVAQTSGAINTQTHLIAIDLVTGQTAWETEKAKGMIGDVVPVYAKNMVLIVTAASGGKSKLDLLAVDMNDGKVKWESEVDDKADMFRAEKSSGLFPKFDLHGHAKPTVDKDAIYLAYAGIHRVDIETGKIVWKSAFDMTEKTFARTNASPLVADAVVYSSAKGVVRAFDKSSGNLLWTSADYGAGVSQLELVNGVLYGRMGGVFYDTAGKDYVKKGPLGVIALDVKTGQLRWRYDGAQDNITNFVVLPESNSVLIADAKNLTGLSMDAEGNKVKESFKVPLEFKVKGSGGMKAAKIGFGALRGGAIGVAKAASSSGPGDPPVALLPRSGDLIVVRGTQHAMGFDPKARTIKWAEHADPPGISTFNKIATSAIFAAIYLAQTQQAMSTNLGTSENNSANADRRRTTDQWDKAVTKRFSKTNATGNYTYMLSDVKTADGKGPGITGVNLDTGEADRFVLFGDREPEYVIDEFAGIVYRTHKSGKEITATQVR